MSYSREDFHHADKITVDYLGGHISKLDTTRLRHIQYLTPRTVEMFIYSLEKSRL